MLHPAQYFASHRLRVLRFFAIAFFVGVLEFVEALHEYHYVQPLIHLP